MRHHKSIEATPHPAAYVVCAKCMNPGGQMIKNHEGIMVHKQCTRVTNLANLAKVHKNRKEQ